MDTQKYYNTFYANNNEPLSTKNIIVNVATNVLIKCNTLSNDAHGICNPIKSEAVFDDDGNFDPVNSKDPVAANIIVGHEWTSGNLSRVSGVSILNNVMGGVTRNVNGSFETFRVGYGILVLGDLLIENEEETISINNGVRIEGNTITKAIKHGIHNNYVTGITIKNNSIDDVVCPLLQANNCNECIEESCQCCFGTAVFVALNATQVMVQDNNISNVSRGVVLDGNVNVVKDNIILAADDDVVNNGVDNIVIGNV